VAKEVVKPISQKGFCDNGHKMDKTSKLPPKKQNMFTCDVCSVNLIIDDPAEQ